MVAEGPHLGHKDQYMVAVGAGCCTLCDISDLIGPQCVSFCSTDSSQQGQSDVIGGSIDHSWSIIYWTPQCMSPGYPWMPNICHDNLTNYMGQMIMYGAQENTVIQWEMQVIEANLSSFICWLLCLGYKTPRNDSICLINEAPLLLNWLCCEGVRGLGCKKCVVIFYKRNDWRPVMIIW